MVSIRIPAPAPRVQQDPRGVPQFTAPGVVPQQNAQPQQMQQLGEGLQQAGAGAMRAGDYLTDVYNDAKATTLKNSFRESAAKLRNRAAMLTGKNAVEQMPAIRKELDALRGGFADQFENAEQERMFSEFADAAQAEIRVDFDAMERKQTVAFNIGAQDSAAKAEVAEYQAKWRDPEQAAKHKTAALLALTKKGELEGWDDKTLDLEILQATTAMHAGVLDSLTQNSGEMKKYLDANRKEMLPAAVRRAEGMLQDATDNSVAVDFHLRAVENAATRGGTLAEQQARAEAVLVESYKGKRLTADQFLKAQSLIRTGYMEQRRSAALAVNDAMTQAEKVLADNPALGIAALDPKIVQTVKDGGSWDALVRFANYGRYATDPEGFAEVIGWDAAKHRTVSDEEFAQHIVRVASKSGQAQLLARRNQLIGSAAQKAAAHSFLKADDRLESIGMKALKFDTEGARMTPEAKRIALDDWKEAAQNRYQKFLTDKKLTDSESAKWLWLNEEDKQSAIDASGTPVSTFDLPVTEWNDPFVRFQGRVIRQSRLPVSITASLGGSPRLLDQEQVQAAFLKAFNREPSVLELAAYMDILIAGGPMPAQADQLVPSQPRAVEQRSAAERAAFEQRVLERGAGGKR